MTANPTTTQTEGAQLGQLPAVHPIHPEAEISDAPGNGATDPADGRWDDVRHSHSDLFPTVDAPANPKDGASIDPPRTGFRVGDLDDGEILEQDPTQWSRLKRLHHDVGPDYSKSNRKRDTLRRDARHRELDAILQQIEIPDQIREWAISRVFSEEIRGFNREHNGSIGAAIGFALLALAEDLQDALDSQWFDRIASVVDDLPDEDVDLDPEALVEYMFESHHWEVRC